jgi:hypothetical protein
MNRLAGSFIVLCFIFVFSSTALAALAEHQVISHKVSNAPTLDGDINDAVWHGIKPDVIHDYTASVNFFMKSVHTDDKRPSPNTSQVHTGKTPSFSSGA